MALFSRFVNIWENMNQFTTELITRRRVGESSAKDQAKFCCFVHIAVVQISAIPRTTTCISPKLTRYNFSWTQWQRYALETRLWRKTWLSNWSFEERTSGAAGELRRESVFGSVEANPVQFNEYPLHHWQRLGSGRQHSHRTSVIFFGRWKCR